MNGVARWAILGGWLIAAMLGSIGFMSEVLRLGSLSILLSFLLIEPITFRIFWDWLTEKPDSLLLDAIADWFFVLSRWVLILGLITAALVFAGVAPVWPWAWVLVLALGLKVVSGVMDTLMDKYYYPGPGDIEMEPADLIET